MAHPRIAVSALHTLKLDRPSFMSLSAEVKACISSMRYANGKPVTEAERTTFSALQRLSIRPRPSSWSSNAWKSGRIDIQIMVSLATLASLKSHDMDRHFAFGLASMKPEVCTQVIIASNGDFLDEDKEFFRSLKNFVMSMRNSSEALWKLDLERVYNPPLDQAYTISGLSVESQHMETLLKEQQRTFIEAMATSIYQRSSTIMLERIYSAMSALITLTYPNSTSKSDRKVSDWALALHSNCLDIGRTLERYLRRPCGSMACNVFARTQDMCKSDAYANLCSYFEKFPDKLPAETIKSVNRVFTIFLAYQRLERLTRRHHNLPKNIEVHYVEARRRRIGTESRAIHCHLQVAWVLQKLEQDIPKATISQVICSERLSIIEKAILSSFWKRGRCNVQYSRSFDNQIFPPLTNSQCKTLKSIVQPLV